MSSALRVAKAPFIWIAKRRPVVIGGVIFGWIVVFTVYLLKTSLEVPTFLKAITAFFNDIANISLIADKFFEKIEGAILELRKATETFSEHLAGQKEKQLSAFEKHGIVIQKIFTLFLTCYNTILDGILHGLSTMIEFANKNPILSSVIVVTFVIMCSGIVAMSLIGIGKLLGTSSASYKFLIGLLGSFASVTISPIQRYKDWREKKNNPPGDDGDVAGNPQEHLNSVE